MSKILVRTFVILSLWACSSEPDLLTYHDGYWVASLPAGPSLEVTLTNDMHVDLETGRATVYARIEAMGQVVSPPQVGPGECTDLQDETVCFHPNAVYLNESGAELDEADGTGAWWIKHSWIVDGEGFLNCEPLPLAETYDDCRWATGELLEDGVTMSMHVGDWGEPASFNNLRAPLLDETPIRYEVANYTPQSTDPSAPDDTRVSNGATVFDCVEEVSAFDGEIRPCPVLVE